jgi:nucleotidyltransferase substrate binding protein (TIGR01987 family)
MEPLDVRWKQRFSNYRKALHQLQEFVDKKNLSKLEEQGLIKAFEYTYELAWNSIKDFYESQGESNIQGSRDAIRLAFKRGLIKEGAQWMNMIQSRIETAHTYNEAVAKKVSHAILSSYYPLFKTLELELSKL